MSKTLTEFITIIKHKIVSRETTKLEVFELLSLLGIIVSIFFPIRYVLENKYANILGYYSDFTSISIYLSFAFVLCFIGIGIYREVVLQKNRMILKLLGLLALSLILYQIIVPTDYKIISFYHHLRISCVLLLGYLVYKSPIWLKYKGIVLWTSVLLAVSQSVIALVQFTTQQSLGLNILGESPLAVTMYGVAKVVSHGTTYIRGYGTLPHPNILAGILVIVSTFNLYLLNKSNQVKQRVVLSISFFLIVMGLFSTMSRGGILALGISFTTWLILNSYRKKSLLFTRKLWIVPLSLLIALATFYPWIVSRGTLTDTATAERAVYAQVGQEIIKDNWLVGTGPGTNMFHMEQILSGQLELWNIQPIHNFWLILLSEWGIIGLFICLFLLFTIYTAIKKSVPRGTLTESAPNCWNVTLASIAVSLFVLFLLDHYFYTIWPAQILLALVIGLMWQNNVPRET